MFMRVEEKPNLALRPEISEIHPKDWDILANFWYPVALARDLFDKALPAKLLDVGLVLFRDFDGAVVALRDTCPHRHVQLSPGRVINGEIECPFHGLRFNGVGQCTLVPALGDRGKLPASYRVQAFPVEERYGLIWVCIGDAGRNSLPEFPLLSSENPDDLGYNEPVIWPASAPRQVENFFDLAHLPIAHANTLGGDPAVPVPPGRIENTNDAVILRAMTPSTASDGRAIIDELTYRVVLPFSVDFSTVSEEPMHNLISCDIATPISAYETQVFQIFKVEGDTNTRAAMMELLVAANNEDIALLKTLQLSDLPLDQHHEIHLPVDNMAYAYRARLKDLGLGQA